MAVDGKKKSIKKKKKTREKCKIIVMFKKVIKISSK
jgi:hypothetical protein